MNSTKENQKIEISIIVPVYNVEFFLPRCLESLINQSFDRKKYEIIIINDGSTDGSGKICEQYANKYDNIIYKTQKNKGLSGARNTGLRIAKGEYICFVDSDDFIHHDFLIKMYNALIDHDCQVSICKGYRALPHANGDMIIYKNRIKFPGIGFHKDLEPLTSRVSFAAWGKLFKRELFQNQFFTEGITYEDLALIPIVLKNSKGIYILNDYLYYYTINENSILLSSVKNKKINFDLLSAFQILKQSELDVNTLSVIFIRYVLSSLCWNIVALQQNGIDKVRELVNTGLKDFPNLKLKVDEIDSLGFSHKIFIKLILNKHFVLSKLYVKFIIFLREVKLSIKRNLK